MPIVDEINKGRPLRERKGRPCETTILEVGSGSLGIAPYLGQKITGLDLDFSGPDFPLLTRIKGDATHIPFPDQSFDFVVSVDVLEHVPSKKRKRAINEALRVAKFGVFLGIPCGKEAEKQDKLHHQQYKKIFGQPFPFLAQQVKLGLPTEDEMLRMIKECADKQKKKIRIKVKSNLNLSVRRLLMWGWMTKNPIIDFIFRKVFLIFIPVLRHLNWEPTYRKLFFVYLR